MHIQKWPVVKEEPKIYCNLRDNECKSLKKTLMIKETCSWSPCFHREAVFPSCLSNRAKMDEKMVMSVPIFYHHLTRLTLFVAVLFLW